MLRLKNQTSFTLMGCIGLVFVIILFLYYSYVLAEFNPDYNSVGISLAEATFRGYDNVTGADHFIVPNIVHFIRFNQTEFQLHEFVCIVAAFRNQKPDFIYIHSNVGEKFEGKYWEMIQRHKQLKKRIRLIPTPFTSHVFDQKINPKWIQHSGDVARIQILLEYGGIYLDSDCYIINNLDKYRKFEFSVSIYESVGAIGNQVMIASKDSRFLKIYMESYRNNYRNNLWIYNAAVIPYEEIYLFHPELVHRVYNKFGIDIPISAMLFNNTEFKWRDLDVIHLLINQRIWAVPESWKEVEDINEEVIKTYKYPYGEMAREIQEFYNATINEKKF